MDDQPDFSNATPLAETEHGPAVSTVDQPDFSNSEPMVEKTPQPRNTVVSRVLYHALNLFPSPIQRMQADMWVNDNVGDKLENETGDQYMKRVHDAYTAYDQHVVSGGVEAVLKDPMDAAIAVGAVTKPIGTAIGLAGFTGLEHMLHLRQRFDEKFPNANPEVQDLVSIGSMLLNGLILGGGVYQAKKMIQAKQLETAGVPKNVNVPHQELNNVLSSENLLPEEKLDLQRTIGVEPQHLEAATAAGLPINVETMKFLTLAEKPYWERAKAELLGDNLPTQDALNLKNTEQALAFGKQNKDNPLVLQLLKGVYDVNLLKVKEIQRQSEEAVKAGDLKLSDQLDSEGFVLSQKNQLFREALEGAGTSKDFAMPEFKDMEALAAQKDISIAGLARLKKFMDISENKNATPGQIAKLTNMINDLKLGDKFLSEKQLAAMDKILDEFPVPEVTPKRVILEKLGEEILPEGIMSKVAPELVPTVEIKAGNPIITKIVNNARDLLDHAEKEINRRNEKLDKMLLHAEKSRAKLLTPQERLSRAFFHRNDEIFRALGGEKLTLTKEEAGVVAYLRNFFAKAKDDLQLEKSRRNYVTHMEKTMTEKILTKGLWPTIKEFLNKDRKNEELPTELLLELENIIGSEKFFKYAMERKGGLEPTTNLRQIINGYSSLYETKMALDKILPEGQAVVQTLLKGKSALWMKRFLQNLKGRGMDYNFRTGPMAWVAKTADAIIDVGYIKLLALDPWSALKNIVAGETNSWIYSDFKSYLLGKQRFAENPKKVIEMAQNFGMLDGTYSDYAQRGIGSYKKVQDWMMAGQRGGEIGVRGSIMASMLTEAEWASGKISKERVNEMKDTIAITQGIFSKADSPLFVQTWYGRMFMQMNRWRITNALLVRKIAVDAIPDIKAGKFNTPEVNRLTKMMVAYGVGMYISAQLYEAGHDKAGDVAKNMAQTLNGMFALFTEGDLKKMIKENPTFSVLGEFLNTIQNAAAYYGFPGAKETKERGIEETYVAPIKVSEDLLNTLEQQ